MRTPSWRYRSPLAPLAAAVPMAKETEAAAEARTARLRRSAVTRQFKADRRR